MKSSTDYVAKNFYSAIDLRNKAVEMEKTDISKAIKLYQDASTKFYNTTVQPNCSAQIKAQSEELKAQCVQRAKALIQFLENQDSNDRKRSKTLSSSNITTPTAPPQRRLTLDNKTQSNSHIPSPVVPSNPNIYQNTAQVPSNQNIYQTVAQVPQNTPLPDQNNASLNLSSSSNNWQNTTQTQQANDLDNYNEAYKYLEYGLLMDNDGFYDLAKIFYSKSISSFSMFISTAMQVNQGNIKFWCYQLQQRIERLGFYQSTSPDASSFYFNKSFHILDEIKKLQNSQSEDAEVIQRKLDQYISEFISLLQRCIFTNNDTYLTSLSQTYLETKMASNVKSEQDNSFHSTYIQEYYPDRLNVFASAKVKGELSAALKSNKKFILIYGPSGTKINKLIQSTASEVSAKFVFVVNFLKFIGTNENPADVLRAAFDKAKSETPSYLIFSHIDSCFETDKPDDDMAKLISNSLTSIISSIPDGVNVFCTSYMPWKIPVPIFNLFGQKIYYPAPEVPVIISILKSHSITRQINDEQISLIANELVGYTEFVIERILIEAQISNAVQSSGGLKNNIFNDISQGFILRNIISPHDVAQAKLYIQPTVPPEGLKFFDQFSEKTKQAIM